MSSFVPSLVYPGRYFPHRTLPELVNYLLQSPGWRSLMRDETNAEMLREVLFTTYFERMSLMGHIIATVYEIKLKEGHNQGTTAIFYLWLKDDFLSFFNTG